MKFNKILGAGLVGVMALSASFISCEKSFDSKFSTENSTDNNAVAQVFIATVNASRNYVSVNGTNVTGSLMSSGSLFPSVGYGFKVPGGNANIRVWDTLRTTTQAELAFSQNMQFGKHHTIFIYDTITSPKQKTVEDDIVVPSDTSARMRFANFIYNPVAVPAIDVFSYTLNRNVFVNVPVTGVTNFIPYPSRVSVDTLYIRETGTTTNIIKLVLNNAVVAKRNYTLVYRGSHRGTRTASFYATY